MALNVAWGVFSSRAPGHLLKTDRNKPSRIVEVTDRDIASAAQDLSRGGLGCISRSIGWGSDQRSGSQALANPSHGRSQPSNRGVRRHANGKLNSAPMPVKKSGQVTGPGEQPAEARAQQIRSQLSRRRRAAGFDSTGSVVASDLRLEASPSGRGICGTGRV